MLIAYRDSKTTNTQLLSPRAATPISRALLLTVFAETVKAVSNKPAKWAPRSFTRLRIKPRAMPVGLHS